MTHDLRGIPAIPLVTVTPRPLNARLWQLVERESNGTATADERLELGCLCNALEAGQDNGERA